MSAPHEELESRTYELLVKLKPHCTDDEFALLCYLAGMSRGLFK